MKLSRSSLQSGMTLVESMVALGIAGIVLSGAVKLLANLSVQKEIVDAQIGLDGVRWYIRDSLDCKRTFNISASTKLPLNCADFPAGSSISLRTGPTGNSPGGTDINRIFEKTNWKFRAFCSNNSLVVQYTPRSAKAFKTAQKNTIAPLGEVFPLRQLRPSEYGELRGLPRSVGFTPVGNAFASEKPVECPPTNSLGTLFAVARFAAQTVLNAAHVNDGMDKFREQLKSQTAVSQAGISSGIGSLARDVGSSNAAVQAKAVDMQAYANKWMGDLAVRSLQKGGEAVAGKVVSGVMGGKGIDTSNVLATFTQGTVDGAAKALGAPPIGSNFMSAMRSGNVGMAEILRGAPVIDSGLDVFAQIPLKMTVAALDVQKTIQQRTDETANILWSGMSRGLPIDQLGKLLNQSAYENKKFMNDEATSQFNRLLDFNVGGPLKKVLGAEVDELKQNLGTQFWNMENEAKKNPSTMNQVLGAIGARRSDVLKQVDGLKGVLNKQVDGMLAGVKADFAKQMAEAGENLTKGFRDVMEKVLKDAQNAKSTSRTQFRDMISKLKYDPSIGPDVGKLGVKMPLNGEGWLDLFDGASAFCRDEFSGNPMRDFLPESNPCPYMNGGQYPFFAGRRSGDPTCCREVMSSQGDARCESHEFAVYGGAECTGDGASLSGVRVGRTDVRPVFQGQGYGLGALFNISPSFGGVVPPAAPNPVPHQHVVQGGAPVVVLPVGPGALTVRDPFYMANMWLGGFLRGNTLQFSNSGQPSGQAAACYFANQRGSRHSDWVGESARYRERSKTLCCPVLNLN